MSDDDDDNGDYDYKDDVIIPRLDMELWMELNVAPGYGSPNFILLVVVYLDGWMDEWRT